MGGMATTEIIEDGWKQLRSGLSLVVWSRLASWDMQKQNLIAENSDQFATYQKALHCDFGQLICWLAFGVGGEYIVKGVFMLNGHPLRKSVHVIRPPSESEQIKDWAALVNSEDPSIDRVDISFGMLGKTQLAKLPWSMVIPNEMERGTAAASIKLLAMAIRNRDAHSYKQGVRGLDFPMVERLFVPAFNCLLTSVDQTELRKQLFGLF
jgi:hypothetical protein